MIAALAQQKNENSEGRGTISIENILTTSNLHVVLDTDGAFDIHMGKGGAGICIHDGNGTALKVRRQPTSGRDVIYNELVTINIGIQACNEDQWKKILLYTDAKRGS